MNIQIESDNKQMPCSCHQFFVTILLWLLAWKTRAFSSNLDFACRFRNEPFVTQNYLVRFRWHTTNLEKKIGKLLFEPGRFQKFMQQKNSLETENLYDDEEKEIGTENNDLITGSKAAQKQEKELASLRSEILPRKKAFSTMSEEGRNGSTDPFIPVFAVLSLVGLFGAYGYEIIRLYSRGELYLPWL